MRRSICLATTLFAMLALALPARAETVESDFVLIRPGDVIGEDLYALANRVEIAGRIEGDLVVAAAGEVVISGTVTGDVLVLSGSVVIRGRVDGSVRGLTRTLSVEGGSVGEDVVVSAWQVFTDGDIARDLVVWANSVDAGGLIGRDLDGQQRRMTLSGEVGRDVDVAVGRLTVEEGASVAGDLRFVSSNNALIDAGARVDGQQVARKPLAPNVRIRALGLLVAVLGGLTAAGAGLALLWAIPQPTTSAARRLRHRPLASLVTGVLMVSVLPGLVAVGWVLFATASPEAVLPLLAVFIPLFSALAGLMLLALLVAPAPVAIILGSVIGRHRTPHAHLLLGVLILGLAAALPWVGLAVLALAVSAGLGAWVVSEADATIEGLEVVETVPTPPVLLGP